MSIHLLSSTAEALAFLRARVTGTLHTDSRQIAPGDGFIAWPGAAVDGRAYVAQALARGAAACLVEAHGLPPDTVEHAHLAALPDLKAATGEIAAAWFHHPAQGAQGLQVLAVTGTNGKTSSACWLAEALNLLSKKELLAQAGCGLVGTLGVGVPPQLTSTGMTTPDPVRLQRAFRSFADQGLRYGAIEASSIGIEEGRLAGTHVRCAVWTNLTQDHLDYHQSMQAYAQAKERLFDWPGLQAAVLNIDDAQGARLHARLLGRAGLDVWSYSLQPGARLVAQDIGPAAQGLRCTVVEGAQHVALQTRLIGQYNISNLLGVIAALRSLGVPLAAAVAVCAELSPVPGRMEQIALPGQPLIAVDYAHTADALTQALAALAPLAQARGGRLWCVFGCGGNRDATKRPLMGAAAQQGAQQVIVTSDNPRGEVPEAIVAQILQGMVSGPALHAEPDRARAIAQAIAQAHSADVVLIAGKGHEDYQEVQGVRHPFSDLQQARSALAARVQQQEMAA